MFPSTSCSTGCLMVREWLQKTATEDGIRAARTAVARIAEQVAKSWGTSAYLEATAHGASSSKFQAILTPTLQQLGYEPEQRNKVLEAGFKPDFLFCQDGVGVMIEVERGKTIDNNMDMLDMWKCHIHPIARHLVLLVPIWYVKVSPKTGKETRASTFARVCRRMNPFFETGNETNVRTLHVIGY